MSDYRDFLASKRLVASDAGFSVDRRALVSPLYDFQKDIVQWALKRGRAAIFADCGLGKTPMQLEWAYQVFRLTSGPVLILAPLAVAQQTVREGRKFGLIPTLCRSQADVEAGINVANYEMLAHFDPSQFAGVVLDESSILKSYMGATKRALVEAFARTPYRLCCTATPAPNDHIELGNHGEFLGIMPSSEMLSRWFLNDTSRTGRYRLKGHAEADFWDWVASWGVSMRRPSDLGYPDDGFALPPLSLLQVDVKVDLTEDRGDHLFRVPKLNATGVHQELRRTTSARAAVVAGMVNSSPDTWIVWVNTNYEADALAKRIPDAIEVRGSESLDAKERKLGLFLDGQARVLIAKPSMFGYGLNLQFCHKVAFMGLSYSFEQLYQALRRVYRFGQAHPVDAYVVVAETEGEIVQVVKAKMDAHERLLESMNRSSAKLLGQGDRKLAAYEPREDMQVPEWLRGVA